MDAAERKGDAIITERDMMTNSTGERGGERGRGEGGRGEGDETETANTHKHRVQAKQEDGGD